MFTRSRAGDFGEGESGSIEAMSGMDRSQLELIPEGMGSFVEAGKVAGVVTLAARNGAVESLEAIGYADLASRTPMRSDTIFQVRSMTKPVTATGIMILAQDGGLELSDLVAAHLPEFAETYVFDTGGLRWPNRPMTIWDLLTHTSGLEDSSALRPWDARVSLTELVRILAREPLVFDPGTKYLYSDAGYDILGRIIEVASGVSYEEFISDRIFTPLGMVDSFFLNPEGRFSRIATGYTVVNGALMDLVPDIAEFNTPVREIYQRKNPGPSWGMLSTASDVFVFHQMMLNRGSYGGHELLTSRSVDLMTKARPADEDPEVAPSGSRPPGTTYSAGWVVVRERQQMPGGYAAGTFFHAGGYYTIGWVDPHDEVVGIFLAQRFPWTPELSAEMGAFRSLVAQSIIH
jgi:CubicO group peptidase (beta-lactamase class C family)